MFPNVTPGKPSIARIWKQPAENNSENDMEIKVAKISKIELSEYGKSLTNTSSWDGGMLSELFIRFQPECRSAGRDINEILLFFAPNDLSDIMNPMIRGHISALKQNVTQNIEFNIEAHLEFEKKRMCYSPCKHHALHYDRIVEILVKVAQDTERRLAQRLPFCVVKAQAAFIPFTETLAYLMLKRKQGLHKIPSRVYADLFKAFAEMHQLKLSEGASYCGEAFVHNLLTSHQLDLVYMKNDRTIAVVKVFNGCDSAQQPDHEEHNSSLKIWDGRCDEAMPLMCDNCGYAGTCCSEITRMTAKWSDAPCRGGAVDMDGCVRAQVAGDMLVALCREDVQPYFLHPPRILCIVVQETFVRFAKLKVDEDDILKIRCGDLSREDLIISYTRPYNMLNKLDREYLSSALLRLTDLTDYDM